MRRLPFPAPSLGAPLLGGVSVASSDAENAVADKHTRELLQRAWTICVDLNLPITADMLRLVLDEYNDQLRNYIEVSRAGAALALFAAKERLFSLKYKGAFLGSPEHLEFEAATHDWTLDQINAELRKFDPKLTSVT